MDIIPSPKVKLIILLSATVLSLLACIYLWASSLLGMPYSGILAFVLIVLPVFSSLYAYRGTLSYVFLGLAVVSSFCATLYIVDMSATYKTAETICMRLDKSNDFSMQPDYLSCSAKSESDGFNINIVSGGPASLLFWPLAIGFLLGVCNLALMPIALMAKKHRKNK